MSALCVCVVVKLWDVVVVVPEIDVVIVGVVCHYICDGGYC